MHTAGIKCLGWLAVIGVAHAPPAFAQANAERGKKAYDMQCALCHSLTENKIGPHHAGLLGRKAGSVKGYDYSPGFAKIDIVWNEKNLDAWIAFPENLVAGQKMGFYVMDAAVRADVIAYLKAQSAAR
jgi:cytochrome c